MQEVTKKIISKLIVEKKLKQLFEKNLSKLYKIKLINKDFLLMKEKDIKLNDNIILGNLPYNVSTEILIKLI